MKATLVHVHVKPEHLQAFIRATKANHLGSVAEPGNVRFDVIQSGDDPARFILYEVFKDEESAKAHKETAHYLAWREQVADWMAEPREGVPYQLLFPNA
jgi:autoinducer 2-degrading protein